MRVLVTGGGRLGAHLTRDFLVHGHAVVNADRRPLPASEAPSEGSDYRYRDTDLGDIGQVAGALTGCDPVVHLGAIPVPYGHADEVVFTQNTRATFAVLQADNLLGVRTAVLASSLATLGMALGPQPAPLWYAPVDEAHPLLPADPYALGKEVDERIGETFHRQTGMSVVAHRFHWVAQPEEAVAAASGTAANPERGARLLALRRHPGRGDGLPVRREGRWSRVRVFRHRRRRYAKRDADRGAPRTIHAPGRVAGIDPRRGECLLDREGPPSPRVRATPQLANAVT